MNIYIYLIIFACIFNYKYSNSLFTEFTPNKSVSQECPKLTSGPPLQLGLGRQITIARGSLKHCSKQMWCYGWLEIHGNPLFCIIFNFRYRQAPQKNMCFFQNCLRLRGDGWRRWMARSSNLGIHVHSTAADGRSTSTHCEGSGARRCGSCSIQAESRMYLCQCLRFL